MTTATPDPAPPVRPSRETGRRVAVALRHPFAELERGVSRLLHVAAKGESGATPLIVVATWIVVLVPLVLLTVGLARLAAAIAAG
jgi:hypothetical protein